MPVAFEEGRDPVQQEAGLMPEVSEKRQLGWVLKGAGRKELLRSPN
jgi:hypothetical protein